MLSCCGMGVHDVGCCGYGQTVALRRAPSTLVKPLDPAIGAPLTTLRAKLYEEGRTDPLRICGLADDHRGEGFDPYGPDSPKFCMAQYAKETNSGFRNALRSVFAAYRSRDDKKRADEFVPRVEYMLMQEAGLGHQEARNYVWFDYKQVFGTSPIAIAVTRFPGRITEPTPTPLPTTNGTFIMGGRGEPDLQEQPLAPAADEPNYLLYAAIGVAVLGVGYFALRGKR